MKVYRRLTNVFLRDYLDVEAKRLVEGISITADTNTMTKEITQVVGVKWDTDKDVFQIDVQAKIVEASKEPVTKRLLLKLMSKFYDPLCLFAPVTVIVKILFQDTWLSGIKWDELLPPAVAQQWHKWINQLQCLKDIRIPRWIGFSKTSPSCVLRCF
ncbi:integrase catalytic domain-containing protein [Nephila pilipes]|uniref:Integrase catalytic domain-containing protein n=1 Tax=Nephila pilipes TaxID=299642 RepID=A0A8X6ML65_NEPPI|nr:integrase catalytic domain-containing protein [Nephila pilipes]